MFDSAVLEVAIGMVVVYLLLSLAATALIEAWMEAVQRRGRLLHSHIHRLIGTDATATLYADARVLSLMSRSGGLSGMKDRAIFRRVLARHYPQPTLSPPDERHATRHRAPLPPGEGLG